MTPPILGWNAVINEPGALCPARPKARGGERVLNPTNPAAFWVGLGQNVSGYFGEFARFGCKG